MSYKAPSAQLRRFPVVGFKMTHLQRKIVRDLSCLVGAVQSIIIDGQEYHVDSERSVHVRGQTNCDMLYKLLFDFHREKSQQITNILTQVYGNRKKAKKRVNEHFLWLDVIRGCIHEDRDQVRLVVRKICKMSDTELTLFLNDGNSTVIFQRMLKCTHCDPVDKILKMYYEIMGQHRRERIYANFKRTKTDESVLAARLNCSSSVVQLFPQTTSGNMIAIETPVMLAMQRAAQNLYSDPVMQIVLKYCHVVMQNGLMVNALKNPETARTELICSMARMLRKSLRKNRTYVMRTMATHFGITVEQFGRAMKHDPYCIVNRLLLKTVKACGKVFALFEAITDVPSKEVSPKYEDSTNSSELESDLEAKLHPWTMNSTAISHLKGQRTQEVTAEKKKKTSEIRKKEQQKRNEKQARANARKKTTASCTPTPVGEAASAFDKNREDELAKREAEQSRREQRSDMVESQQFQRSLDMDDEKRALEVRKRELDARESELRAEELRVQELKTEHTRTVGKLREQAKAELQEQRQRHGDYIASRLGDVAAEMARLEQKRREVREETLAVQRSSEGVAAEGERMRAEHDRFEAYMIDKQAQLEAEKAELLADKRRVTVEMCESYVKMAGALVQEHVTNAVTNTVQQQAASREPATGILVDVPYPRVSTSNPSGTRQAGYSILSADLMPSLDENIAWPDSN